MVSLMIQVNENDWRLKCNRQFYGERLVRAMHDKVSERRLY